MAFTVASIFNFLEEVLCSVNFSLNFAFVYSCVRITLWGKLLAETLLRTRPSMFFHGAVSMVGLLIGLTCGFPEHFG